MSKISVNSDVALKTVKIYVMNGVFYADLIGEAASDIGPANYNFLRLPLDFNTPEQTEISAFCFKDGKGRVGYEFNFGDVLYANRGNEPEDMSVDEDPWDTEVVEEDVE